MDCFTNIFTRFLRLGTFLLHCCLKNKGIVILNKCSLDLMLLLIEESKKDRLKVQRAWYGRTTHTIPAMVSGQDQESSRNLSFCLKYRIQISMPLLKRLAMIKKGREHVLLIFF